MAKNRPLSDNIRGLGFLPCRIHVDTNIEFEEIADDGAGHVVIVRTDQRKPIMVVDLCHGRSANPLGAVKLVRAV